ncbi:MAG: glycoside hydrolase family 88 protein [candidate division KSB1 bacterium]|nr:glycoside hydrolase family 88 protein [candidate division KSB1 bacterium]
MTPKRLLIYALFLVFLFSFALFSQPGPGSAYQSMTDNGAWCWFSDPRAVYHDGTVYTGWVTNTGDITVGALNTKSMNLEQTILHKNLTADDHAHPSLLIRPDGRIVVFYSKHGGDKMYIRVSKKPHDISVWGPVIHPEFDHSGNGICYTNPAQLSGEKNRMYLFWRGIDWKPTFSLSDDGGRSWADDRKLIESEGARPYVKVVSDGDNSIHFAFTDGHPRQQPENSIYYMKYENGNFYKADGSEIKSMDDLPIQVKETDVVYDGKRTKVRAWIWDLALDDQGRPVIAYTRLPDENDHRYHYVRWNGNGWKDHELCIAGGWFPETPKHNTEREPHYSGGLVLDHDNPDMVYLSRDVSGTFEIEKWQTPDKGTTWIATPITRNSNYDQVRPVAVRGHQGEPSVLWMHNRSYTHYTKYNSEIKMNIKKTSLSADFDPDAVYRAMQRVADWQWANPSQHSPRDWTTGALMSGMTAWAEMAQDPVYLDSLLAFSERAGWRPGDRIYHADDHCIAWTYLQLYERYGDPSMIKPIRDRFDYILEHPAETQLDWTTPGASKRWGWCDALYMGPPVWAKLAQITGDDRYLNFMNREWWATTDYLYDTDEHLYYRDSRYFERRERNDEKIFWSRGNGWVFAGLARVLETLPLNYPDRDRYEALYKEMAARIVELQTGDGLWHSSLLDPESYPVPETSGSGFYTYGLAWGINHGLLDRKEYLPSVKQAWTALVESVYRSGKLGYVQPIGADPRNVKPEMTEIYGVGAFLYAGSEVYKLTLFDGAPRLTVHAANPLTQRRGPETLEVDADVLSKNGFKTVEKCAVFDVQENRFLVSQALKLDRRPVADLLLFQSDFAPGERRTFWIVEQRKDYDIPEPEYKAHAMFVPERKDDFAWESDRIAYRMYGPALEEETISAGIDVWVKSVHYPILHKWYAGEDYHSDHGEGLDFYKVGPTSGCGGFVFSGKDTLYTAPHNFREWRILANGPIRSVFELDYADWNTGNGESRETKRISLDLGSNLNRIECRFPDLQTPASGDCSHCSA